MSVETNPPTDKDVRRTFVAEGHATVDVAVPVEYPRMGNPSSALDGLPIRGPIHWSGDRFDESANPSYSSVSLRLGYLNGQLF